MLTVLLLWVSVHRLAIFGVVAAGFWVAAYAYYFKTDFFNFRKNRQAHHWGVDMGKKTVTAGRTALR